MINDVTINGALVPARELVEKNILLNVVPDTILSQLYNSSFVDLSKENIETIPWVNDVKDNVLYATADSDQGPSPHSLVLNEAVDILAPIITNQINVARNVIKPLVVDMAESLNNFKDQIASKDPSSDFSIKVESIPELSKNILIYDEIVKYDGVTTLTPDLKLYLEDKDFDEIVKDLTSFSSSLSKEIAEVVSYIGKDELISLYRTWFTRETPEENLNNSTLATLTPFKRLNYSLVMYLLSVKYINETQSTSDNKTNLSSYNKALVQLRDYAGSLAYNAMRQIERLVNSKQLIVKKDERNKTIMLNGELYYTWLKEGGKPEIILGVLVSSVSYSSIKNIDEHAIELEKSWNSYCVLQRSFNTNKTFKTLKDYLENLFFTMLKEPEDIEKEYLLSNPNYTDNVKVMLENYINSLSINDFENIYDIALEVIAKIRFYYTSSYTILKKIEEASSYNPDVDVREAALLAVMEYIVEFATDQVSVKSCL